MSEELPAASASNVLKVVIRVWQELCSPELRRAYYAMWLFATCRLTLGVIYGWTFGYVVEHIPSQQTTMSAILLFLPALCMVLGEYVFDWRIRLTFDSVMTQFNIAADTLIDKRFFEKSIGQHAGENGTFTQGSLTRGRSELLGVNEFLAAGGFESALAAAVSMAGVWIFSPKHGVIVLISFCLSLAWARSVNTQIYHHQYRIGEVERKARRRREDLWDAVKRVKTSGREDEAVAELCQASTSLNREYQRSWNGYQHGTLGRDIINWVGFSVVMVWCIHDFFTGVMSLAPFVATANTTYATLASVRLLARMERKLYMSTPHIERLFQMLDLPPDIVDPPVPTPLPAKPFTVKMEGVCLLRGDQTVLRDVSITIEPGERLALIGPSGAGKTTIVDLLERAMNPSAGRILVDDCDLRHIRLREWYSRVAFVSQNRHIIDGTLRDNILFGLPPEARVYWTDDRIWSLAQQFRVDFGARLTHGLDTRVGRHGLQLSGGEAQRLLILAAAVKEPQFMVIDEATSALDAENQRDVQAALDQLLLRSGASALIIAHRLSTIHACTKFVVLRHVSDNEAQVEAIASSLEELASVSPTYRKLRALEHGVIINPLPVSSPTPEA